jgi:hypothetical protein
MQVRPPEGYEFSSLTLLTEICRNMDNSFFAYLQRLEVIAFFSGYPLLYAVATYFAGKQLIKKIPGPVLISLLPLGYALIGTLYLGLQAKNLYPDYSMENIRQSVMYNPFLQVWALLAILFWIPALAKKTVLSLLHSLVFFFLLVYNIVTQFILPSSGNSMVRNDMKLYTMSLLLNLGALLFILLVYSLVHRYRHYKAPSRN